MSRRLNCASACVATHTATTIAYPCLQLWKPGEAPDTTERLSTFTVTPHTNTNLAGNAGAGAAHGGDAHAAEVGPQHARSVRVPRPAGVHRRIGRQYGGTTCARNTAQAVIFFE